MGKSTKNRTHLVLDKDKENKRRTEKSKGTRIIDVASKIRVPFERISPLNGSTK